MGDLEHFMELYNKLPTSTGREMQGQTWICPFCTQSVSGTTTHHLMSFPSQEMTRPFDLLIQFMKCPNAACNEVAIQAGLAQPLHPRAVPEIRIGSQKRIVPPDQIVPIEPPTDLWIRPTRPAVKEFPEYIPQAIRKDYTEACLILASSPKASATLSRRCLQGMIRDFHGVKNKANLKQEIDAIKDKVDSEVWTALDGLRKIGNIGAHMEHDVNFIVDVEPNEATLLINLNELLFKEWYINREERKQLLRAVTDAGANKKAAKHGGKNQALSS